MKYELYGSSAFPGGVRIPTTYSEGTGTYLQGDWVKGMGTRLGHVTLKGK